MSRCGFTTVEVYSEEQNMPLSDFPADPEDELIEQLNHLREIGLIEVVGIDKDGDWLYGPTEKGLNLAESFNSIFQLGKDDE